MPVQAPATSHCVAPSACCLEAVRSQLLPNCSKCTSWNNVASCARCALIVTSLSCRIVGLPPRPLTVCTNDDFSTPHQAPPACFAQHAINAVATVILGSARALVSSAACLLAVNIGGFGAACVLVTPACAWPPHSLAHVLCANTFFEEYIDISGMHWHVTVLIVLLAVAPLAASKSTLSRLCAVSVSPRTVMQASNTNKQILSVHCARRSRSWHDGAFSTL